LLRKGSIANMLNNINLMYKSTHFCSLLVIHRFVNFLDISSQDKSILGNCFVFSMAVSTI